MILKIVVIFIFSSLSILAYANNVEVIESFHSPQFYKDVAILCVVLILAIGLIIVIHRDNSKKRIESILEEINIFISTKQIAKAIEKINLLKKFEVINKYPAYLQQSNDCEGAINSIIIETNLKEIITLISKKRVVTAKEKLNLLKNIKEVNKYPTYLQQISDYEDKINTIIAKADSDISKLVKIIYANIVIGRDNAAYNNFSTKILEDPEIPNELKKKLKNGIHEIERIYKKGIILKQEEIFTNYCLGIHQDATYYCYCTVPTKGTIVYPHRRQKVELRGYTEEKFEQDIKSSLEHNDNYQVLGDVSILVADGCHPYEPDIAIIERNNQYGIRIDIEIDEPYSGLDRQPIHYIGCGDDFRDLHLSKLGWVVIRFSEKQVYKETDKCINLIHAVIKGIDCDFQTNRTDIYPTPDKRWTEIEAKKMAVRDYRENLLNHKFGIKEHGSIIQQIPLTEQERLAANKIEPFDIPSSITKNIDNSTVVFLQDSKLQFDSKEHIYLYGSTICLTPVSTLVNNFFTPFDAIEKSRYIARIDNVDQCLILEDWESKGAESREVGTFMHAQKEKYFQNIKPITSTQFIYEGEYIKINKIISIDRELAFFKSFIRDNKSINPFRTEWHICDLDFKIAGTIDLLCKNSNGGYDTYDWKRSRKASPNERVWNYGINGLETTPDISFYHYALQQNLYKYILEKNYNLRVDNMYIVVLHADFENYKQYKIPTMDKEVRKMIRYIQQAY